MVVCKSSYICKYCFLISGVFAVTGGIMLTSENKYIALIGSFGYMVYYLLDYVDGGVLDIMEILV